MKNGYTKNGNLIECIYRRYRVQLSDGISIEIESEKPLSGHVTHILLGEDSEIGSFFENHKIINVVTIKDLPKNKGLLKELTYKRRAIRPKKSEISINPLDRINYMLQMPDKFTRLDYQKFMQTEYKIEMSTYMGHNDIEIALALKKLESVGRTGLRGYCQYRVIDQTEINRDQYKALLKAQRK